MLVSPLATWLTGHSSTRTTLVVGIFLQTVALIGASFANRIWQLFLSQGLCFGWGMGFLFVGSVGVIPQWFTTKRSLANGVGAAGSGLGGLIYSLAAGAIIQRISLGWAFRILGIVSCAVNVTCALLIRDRNKAVQARHIGFDYTLFKRYEFCLLSGFGFFSMLGYIVLLFSLPNYANSIGLTAKQASVIGAVLNLGQGLGRSPIGYWSDSFGRINMAGTMTFASAVFALVIWINAHSYGVLIFYALIGGTVAGTYWAVVAPVTAEVVGLKDLPAALSITWLNLVLPDTFSEPIALEIVSRTGGYLGAQLFAGCMYIAAAICMWLLKAWKVGEMERQAALEHKAPGEVDPLHISPSRREGAVEGRSTGVQRGEGTKISPFLKRLLVWKHV
jgi:MFS family permease